MNKSMQCSFVLQQMDNDISYESALENVVNMFNLSEEEIKKLELELNNYI